MNHSLTNGRANSTDSDESRQNSSPTAEASIGGLDSFVLVGQNAVLEQYKEHLPRRKGYRRKAAEGCGGLSSTSWVFLLLALLQFLAVSGLQITIAVLGRFDENQLDEYVACLQDSLRAHPNIPDNFSITNSSAFPQFGRDKGIYIYFFISLVLYNFIICVYALKQQNITEVYAFMVLNVLAMAYACLQVHQFRGFGSSCPVITNIGYLALANVFILLIFTVFFGLLSLTIYVEFGWKTYRLLNCDPAMRYYYRVYQVLMSVIKIMILFLLMLTIGQCILLLPPHNFEFGPTIVAIFLIATLAFPFTYITVTYEWRIGYFGMFVLAIIAVCYSVFKIVRYTTLTCPLCVEMVDQVRNETLTLRGLTGLPNTTINDDEFTTLFSLDRQEDFGNLTMLASLVLFFVLIASLVLCHHLRFYNKGLKDYFSEQQPNMYLNQHCFKRCHRSGMYDASDGPSQGKRLHLTAVRKLDRSGGASKISTTRDSRLDETVTVVEPTFKDTHSPTKPKVRRFSSIEETYTVPEPDFRNDEPTVVPDRSKIFRRQ